MKNLLFLFSLSLFFCLSSCSPNGPEVKNPETTTPKVVRVKGPAFSSDSAFAFLKAQVAFGPRVPGTPAHDQCAAYFETKLKSYGLTLSTQSTSGTTAIDQKTVKITNIMAAYHPERKDRILLLAHWDTRAFANLDSIRPNETFDGADDGASGCAVLLEIARILQQKDPNIGVDLLFVDAEDGGLDRGDAETWCLGTQFWAQHMPDGYTARFGILLDMVGGKGAVFPREGTGAYYAPDVIQKVWSAAEGLGYGSIFINDITGQTTDDHLYVNQYARIPTIDIVHYDTQTHDYPYWHHRHSDNLDIIDPNTLQIVGTVLVDVIYNEQPKGQ